MKKKGFTLVELLAVIVILAVIGLISVPMILNNIEKSRVSTYRSNTQMLIEASKQYVSKKMEDNDYPQSGINIKDLSFKKGNFKSGIIKRCNEEDVKAGNCTSEEVGEIIAVNIYNGKYCAKGTKQAIEVLKVETEKDCENIDSTSPELTLKVVKKTNNSILIAAYGYDSQSKITKYTFKIGDGEEKVKETESRVATYEFTNLKANQEYEITVSVENENKDNYNETTYKTTKSITVSTLETNIPTFKVSGSGYSSSKEVTITYPKIEGGENYYDITYDGGKTWTTTKANENTTKVVFTKNGKIRAYTKYPGNVVENTLNVIGIDEDGPIFELEVVNENKWEREKVVRVYHKNSDGKKINGALDTGIGLASKAYSFDGGKTWINKYSNAYIKNEIVNVIVRDKMGNKTAKSIAVTRVDRVKPTCTTIYTQPNNYNSSTWTTKNVTIIGICTDTLGECENRIPILTLTQDQNSNLSPGKVCDKAGNCTMCPMTGVKIDKKPPVCVMPIGGNATWTNINNVNVGVLCADGSGSGCTIPIFYSTISGDGIIESATIPIKDNAGNINTCTNIYNKYIDTVKPTCGNWTGESTTWTKANRTIKVNCSDTGSGCTANSYTVGTFNSGTTKTISKLYPIQDKAGNTNWCYKTVNVYVDKTGPTCGNWTGESTTWTKANRTIKVNCSDTGSGCTANSYTVKTYNSGTTKTANLSYTIKDKVGNATKCSKMVNVYVDKIAPSCSSSGGSYSWTNDSRTLIGTCSDSGSGCTGNASWYINWEGNWSNLSPGTVYDYAGNSTYCPANQTVRIDKTAPTGYITGGSNVDANDGTASKKTSDTVTINCNDNGGSGIVSSSAPVSLADKKGRNVTVGYCADHAGNTTSIKANVCKYEANAEHCGTTPVPYSCNPYNCNPYNCNPYRCNCHSNTKTAYGTASSGKKAPKCPRGYSKKKGPYNCGVGGTQKMFCVDCISTNQKCSTCYNTCYQTCYQTCYNHVAKSCCHF